MRRLMLTCTAVAMFIALAAHAAEPWTSDLPLMAETPGTPQTRIAGIAADADGGYLANVVRSDGRQEFLRFDRDHHLISRLNRVGSDSAYLPAFRGASIVLEDGTRYGLGLQGINSQLSDNGAVIWASDPLLSDGPFSFRSRCTHAFKSAQSALWTLCYDDPRHRYSVQRVDSVGRHRKVFESPFGWMTSLALAADGGVYFAWSRSAGSTDIYRRDAGGERLWSSRLDVPSYSTVDAMLGLENGHVLLVAHTRTESTLQLIELDASGSETARSEIDLGFPTTEVLTLQHSSDGSFLLLSRTYQSTDVLVQIRPDRSLDWRLELPPQTNVAARTLKRFSMMRTAAGEVRLIGRRSVPLGDSSAYEYSYIAISAAGELQREVLLGNELEIGGFEARESLGDFLVSRPYARLDGEGQLHGLDLPDLYSGQEQALILAAHSDGGERFAVLERRAGRQLQAWGRDGSLRWVAELARLVDRDQEPTVAQLQVSAQALCWLAADGTVNGTVAAPVQCFDRLTGDAQLSFQPLNPIRYPHTHLLLMNGVMARIEETDGQRTLRFQSVIDGSDIYPSIPVVGLQTRLYGKAGGVGVALDDGNAGQIVWVDGELPERRDLPLGFGDRFVLAKGLLEQGGLYHPRGAGPSVRLHDGFPYYQQVVDRAESAILAIPSSSTMRLLAFNADDGDIVWEATIDIPWADGPARLIDSGEDSEIHLLGAGAADFDFYTIDRSDGRVLDVRSYQCGAQPCRFLLDGPIHSRAGLDVMQLREQDDSTSALRSLHVAAPTASVRADQPGVAGLWYHPGLQGQGLALTYVAETRTLFAPWFTYSNYPVVSDQSANRWYSLQGQAEPGSTTVDLNVLLNQGGAFATPPQVTAEPYGRAQLRFESCDRAVLEYRFDILQDSGSSDALPLVRLGTRTEPCELADGSVQPANAAPDNKGFSSKQSGAWFDPVSSGQGLMIEVVPPSPIDPGLLFAAWFTYDLADASNDYLDQDWFILQSDLAQATAGRVVVPIYRSVGGRHAIGATSNLFRVGEAELEFQSCDSLLVSYRFDDAELAEEHASLQGQLMLQRIGGCVSG